MPTYWRPTDMQEEPKSEMGDHVLLSALSMIASHKTSPPDGRGGMNNRRSHVIAFSNLRNLKIYPSVVL